jgi:hypothetical protein
MRVREGDQSSSTIRMDSSNKLYHGDQALTSWNNIESSRMMKINEILHTFYKLE